jgi:two-component system alkaline phosphatase synthesis response regulator PhoP
MVKKEELVARLESRIKEFRKNSSLLKIGNLSVDLNQIDCHLDGKKLILTLLEFKVLSKLMQTFPHKVTKDELVRSIWGEDKISANNINTHLYNLRLKIADWNHAIENHRTQGFWIDSKKE